MRQLTIESLERRQLMSATYTLTPNGTLTINGSAGDNILLIAPSGNNKTVSVIEVVNKTPYHQFDATMTAVKQVVIHGHGGNDTIVLGDFKVPVQTYGDAGNDSLAGQAGTDYLFGGDGNDTLDGGWGDDFVYGDAGDDVMIDGYKYVQSPDRYSGGSGIDRIDYSQRDQGVTIRLDGTATSGQAGEKDSVFNDVERATGTIYNDVISGNESANVLNGLGGNDILHGRGGNDDLFGGYGNDILTGGAGKDYLIGGKGNDVFYATDGAGGDVIYADDKGVYASSGYDVAWVDDDVTNDLTYGTDKNHWA